MLNEVKTSRPRPRPRPKFRGRGQSYEAEAKTLKSRPRPRPKIIMKKYQIMINHIWFTIIAGKINKIPKFYTIFARNARLHNKTTRSRPDRGQNPEAEAEAARPRPKFWPQGHFGLEDLTSLSKIKNVAAFAAFQFTPRKMNVSYLAS